MLSKVRNFLIILLLFLTASNLYSSDYAEIKYKSSNEIDWIDDISEIDESVIALVDGREIETSVVSVSGSASFVDLNWSWDREEADSFSYRLNGGEWNILDGRENSIVIKNLKTGKFNLFEIYSTKNGVDTEIRAHGVVAKTERTYSYPGSLRLSLVPYSLTIYDFYNGHHIPHAKYLTYSHYSLNADADFGFYFLNRMRISLGSGYSFTRKKETIIPNAFDVHYIKAYCGLDVITVNKGNFTTSFGAFGGLMMHINAKKYNISSYFGARLDFSYALNNHIVLSAGTKFSAAHLPFNEPLMNSISYFIDPVVISTEVRF